MWKTVWLATALLLMVTTAVTPAFAQLAGGAPPPPEYQVTEDGTLVIGGDVLVDCAEVGIVDETLDQATPAVRAQEEEARNEAVQACRIAGFSTAADAPGSTPASTSPQGASTATGGGVLPATGGLALPVLLLGSLTLAVVGAFLALPKRR